MTPSTTSSSAATDRPLLVHHVAKLLGVKCRSVRHWAATGQIAALKSGPRIWTFQRADVTAFAAVRARRGLA
jgi:excisionase family DNA binding protein